MIYFLYAHELDRVKIGFSTDENTLKQRISTLKTASPCELELVAQIDGDYSVESELHNLFEKQNISNLSQREWFDMNQHIIDFLRTNSKACILNEDVLIQWTENNKKELKQIDLENKAQIFMKNSMSEHGFIFLGENELVTNQLYFLTELSLHLFKDIQYDEIDFIYKYIKNFYIQFSASEQNFSIFNILGFRDDQVGYLSNSLKGFFIGSKDNLDNLFLSSNLTVIINDINTP